MDGGVVNGGVVNGDVNVREPPKTRVPKNATDTCYYCNKIIIKKNMSTHLKVCKVKRDEVSNPQSMSVLSELRIENQKLKDELERSHMTIKVLQEFIDKFLDRFNIHVEPASGVNV